MRAHFPDTKSAALACEQIVSAGYPLSHFTLIENRPERKAVPAKPSRPVAHGSLWDRIIHMFGSGSLNEQQRAQAAIALSSSKSPVPQPEPGDPVGETILFSNESVDGTIRAIILQHGGYLEPAPLQPAAANSAA